MTPTIAVFAATETLEVLYRKILENAGYVVSCHPPTAGEIAHLDAIPPDAVIWGHVDGTSSEEWWFLKQLRSQPQTRQVPVVVSTTGYQWVDGWLTGQRRDNVVLLGKPFARDQLLEVVGSVLARRKPSLIYAFSDGSTP